MTPSTSWKEAPPPDEDARFAAFAERFALMQKKNATNGVIRRALHAKGHGIYEASLEVAGDLPEHARHGLFAKPGTYEALVRFSNGAGKVQADKVGDVRGIAVKVLGVPGDKVLGDATTQDFLAVLTPAIPFKNADEFVAVVWAARSPALALFRMIGALGPIRPFQLLPKLVAGMKTPPGSLATKTFYSAVPIQCGPHAVRFSFTPRDTGGDPPGAARDFYGEELASRLARGPAVYDMALQFFVDEATTPIENPSVDWPSPYVKVATLTLAKQDAASERGKKLAERADKLAFDPWHALVAHKPLGGIMRARKVAYYASETGRGATPEPTSIAALLA
jgi:hypothetical protein